MVKRRKTQQRDPQGRETSTYEEENEEAILQDGQTYRVSVFMQDGSPNPKLSDVQRAVGEHAQLSDAEIAREAAYAAYDAREDWRSPDNPAPPPLPTNMSAQDALEAAYRDYDAADAVRYKTNDYLARGKYPGGSFQCEGQPQAGMSCRTQHGVPGVVQVDSEGRFVCIASRHDSASDSMTVEDCYAAYDAEQAVAYLRGK